MDKAILVIDMPKNCYECYLNNYHFCDVTGDSIEEYMNTEYKPDWCPLKPAPEKDEVYYLHEWNAGYKKGWNDCINYVVGN